MLHLLTLSWKSTCWWWNNTFFNLCMGMPHINTHEIIKVLGTIFHSSQHKRKPVNHIVTPYWLYAFHPLSTGIICLLLLLLGPGKYCYFSTLQPPSCSTSLNFHWIKAKCVCLLATTGALGMNYKQATKTNQLHIYTTACRVKYTIRHLLPTTRDYVC